MRAHIVCAHPEPTSYNAHLAAAARAALEGRGWSVTVGTSAGTCAHDGRSGDIDLLPWPVNFSLAYVGYTVLEPFVAVG